MVALMAPLTVAMRAVELAVEMGCMLVLSLVEW